MTANYISQTAMREIAGGDWGKRLRTSLPALDYTSRHDARGVASCGAEGELTRELGT